MTQSFYTDLSKFIDKTNHKADAFLKTVSQEILFKIVTRNPVLTGFSRASWWASVGSESGHPNQPDITKYRQGGLAGSSVSTPMATATLALGQAKMGDVIYLSNNAGYIGQLERGHSKQAPSGMVAVTLAEAQQIAEEVLNKIK